MKTVVCVWWGDKFSVDYVYNLKAMVERNTTVPFRFVCYSDKNIPGIETKRLKPGVEGWWNKLQMFDPSMKVGDYVLYFDLDTIITGNIDWLMNYDTWFMGIEDVGAVNAHQPHLKNVLQTGVMTWDHDANSHIYIDFLMNYDRIKNQFRGDGEYLNTKINPYHRKLLQHEFPGKLKSYKYDIYPGPPDKDVSIVCFHGRPSIVQAMDHSVTTPMRTYEPQKWIKDYWYH
jgi:hypothetical protein